MITASLPRAAPSGSGWLSMMYYGLTITNNVVTQKMYSGKMKNIGYFMGIPRFA